MVYIYTLVLHNLHKYYWLVLSDETNTNYKCQHYNSDTTLNLCRIMKTTLHEFSTWRKHVTCSSSLFCRNFAWSMSQLEVVDPVPKPVPFAQYVCAFSSVLLFCCDAVVDVDVAIDAVAWVAAIIIYTQSMHLQWIHKYDEWEIKWDKWHPEK